MKTRSELERRLSMMEMQHEDHAPVIVDTEEEARRYDGTGRLIIIDDVGDV